MVDANGASELEVSAPKPEVLKLNGALAPGGAKDKVEVPRPEDPNGEPLPPNENDGALLELPVPQVPSPPREEPVEELNAPAVEPPKREPVVAVEPRLKFPQEVLCAAGAAAKEPSDVEDAAPNPPKEKPEPVLAAGAPKAVEPKPVLELLGAPNRPPVPLKLGSAKDPKLLVAAGAAAAPPNPKEEVVAPKPPRLACVFPKRVPSRDELEANDDDEVPKPPKAGATNDEKASTTTVHRGQEKSRRNQFAKFPNTDGTNSVFSNDQYYKLKNNNTCCLEAR